MDNLPLALLSKVGWYDILEPLGGTGGGSPSLSESTSWCVVPILKKKKFSTATVPIQVFNEHAQNPGIVIQMNLKTILKFKKYVCLRLTDHPC